MFTLEILMLQNKDVKKVWLDSWQGGLALLWILRGIHDRPHSYGTTDHKMKRTLKYLNMETDCFSLKIYPFLFNPLPPLCSDYIMRSLGILIVSIVCGRRRRRNCAAPQVIDHQRNRIADSNPIQQCECHHFVFCLYECCLISIFKSSCD